MIDKQQAWQQAGNADPERALALHYARADRRAALAALFALDDALGHVLRATREPLVGQMRLTWWFDALERLDAAPPGEPVLVALAGEVLPHGISGRELAGLVEGWEGLLDPDIDDAITLEQHAMRRGVALFGIAARLAGAAADDPVAPAGRGWALADLARHLSDQGAAARALGLAQAPLRAATGARWSRAGRCLGALAHIAAMNAALPLGSPPSVGAPRRVGRLLWHRMTGR